MTSNQFIFLMIVGLLAPYIDAATEVFAWILVLYSSSQNTLSKV